MAEEERLSEIGFGYSLYFQVRTWADAVQGDCEDDARRLLQTVSKLHGAQVVAAEFAQEGLAKLHDAVPDILSSDIAMPDEDGFSPIAKVRRLHSAEQLSALPFTAFAHEQDRRRACPIFQQAAEPLNPEALISKVLEFALAGMHRPVVVRVLSAVPHARLESAVAVDTARRAVAG